MSHTITAARRDPSSLSNYDRFRTKNIKTEFVIDFSRKRLSGEVRLQLEVLAKEKEIILDSSFLDVKAVAVNQTDAKWTVGTRHEALGSPLTIQLDRDAEVGKMLDVAIQLSTTAQCTALQWLTPQQTANKRHPYVFSQCQAIHARSIFPCQDTPDVKSTFDFRIRSPLPVLTSGNATGLGDYEPAAEGGKGSLLYTFRQDVPIPSYLFAIASGDIAVASIGPRSLVATGPEELCAAKWELEEDTEKFIVAAERIIRGVPYAWGTYNVLILPRSFPYGGMENPVNTFATPSIISGDRDNVDVIAHELSHSWSGNLVSTASWQHFWLNEGWTMYLERRIIAAMHGEQHGSFSAIIGWKALVKSVEHYGKDHEFTKLVVDLRNKDPDDAFSSVPYEKGFVFLYHIEKLVGQELFDQFIAHYFATFARRSLDSDEFKQCVIDFFSASGAADQIRSLDWDAWYHSPGLPPKPDFDTTLVDACYALADRWLARARDGPGTFVPDPRDVEHLRASQLEALLEYLDDHAANQFGAADAELLGHVYGLLRSENLEVLTRYLDLALRCGVRGTVLERTTQVLGKTGRMKFVRPLYRRLRAVDADLAAATFAHNRDFYHPICRQMVERDAQEAAQKQSS